MNKIIPKSVLQEAKSLIELFGNNFKYLGELWGCSVYMFVLPEQQVTGYPFVFMYDHDDETADKITGFEAVDILGEFIKEL